MNAPSKTWTVLPHGPLTAVTAEILTVVGEIHMPLGDFPRRMTVVRLASGGLVVYSAVALGESEMRQIEVFGRPEWIPVDPRCWTGLQRLGAGFTENPPPIVQSATSSCTSSPNFVRVFGGSFTKSCNARARPAVHQL